MLEPSAAGHPPEPLSVDGDALHTLIRFGRFRQDHGEDSLAELRFDLVLLYVGRQRNLPLKVSVVALTDPTTPVFGLTAPLSPQRENPIVEEQLDILLIHARKLGFDLHLRTALGHLHMRKAERRGQRGAASAIKLAPEVIEEPVHLLVKRQDRIGALAAHSRHPRAHAWNQISN